MKATKTLIETVAPQGFDNFVLKCVVCGKDVPEKRATGRSRDTCSPSCNDIFRAFKNWQSFRRRCPACFHPSTPEERDSWREWRKQRGDRRAKPGRPPKPRLTPKILLQLLDGDGWHISDGVDSCAGYDDEAQEASVAALVQKIFELTSLDERVSNDCEIREAIVSDASAQK